MEARAFNVGRYIEPGPLMTLTAVVGPRSAEPLAIVLICVCRVGATAYGLLQSCPRRSR